MKFLVFLFGEKCWKPYSAWVKFLLKFRHGIRVGSDVEFRALPLLKLRAVGRGKNIVIEDGVRILGEIDIRNREHAKIRFGKHTMIEKGCRFVAANDASLIIGKNCAITEGAIINAGADLTIEDDVVIGPRCGVSSSGHAFRGTAPIRELGYEYGPTTIEKGAWIGANVVVTKGVSIGKGSVIGAGSIVTRSIEPMSVCGGVPCRKIRMRVE